MQLFKLIYLSSIISDNGATDIPGLYFSGQDIMSCGFTGALYAGLLTASSALGRNCMSDLISLHKKLNRVEKRKKLD